MKRPVKELFMLRYYLYLVLMKKGYILVFLLFFSGICFAQKHKIDSLLIVLKYAKTDTLKVNTLLALSSAMKDTLTKAKQYANEALLLSDRINYNKGSGKSNYKLGFINYVQGNYPEALTYWFTALKIFEKINNIAGIANTYTWIGNVYSSQNDIPNALKYHLKSLKLNKQTGDKNSIAICFNNLGFLSSNQGNYEKALKYFSDFLKISTETGSKKGRAQALNNIASVYDLLGKYDKSMESSKMAMDIYRELKDYGGIANSELNLSSVNFKLKHFLEARQQLNSALSLAQQIGTKDLQKICYSGLARLDSAQNNWKDALFNYKQFIAYRDSLLNEENTKAAVRLEMNYDFSKKEAASKLELEKKEAVAAAEHKKQNIIIWSVCGILLIVVAFAVFAYRSFLQKQLANIEITKQKEIIETKQKEILDSIHYAKRIQTALLPSEKYMDKSLNKLGL